jgi:hypothetical protein
VLPPALAARAEVLALTDELLLTPDGNDERRTVDGLERTTS